MGFLKGLATAYDFLDEAFNGRVRVIGVLNDVRSSSSDDGPYEYVTIECSVKEWEEATGRTWTPDDGLCQLNYLLEIDE